MKISELIKVHGVPVKIRRNCYDVGEFREVIAEEKVFRYNPSFEANGARFTMDDVHSDWELYVETKPKKKLYGYLSKEIGKIGESIFSDSYVVVLLPRKVETTHSFLVRSPNFDCEV